MNTEAGALVAQVIGRSVTIFDGSGTSTCDAGKVRPVIGDRVVLKQRSDRVEVAEILDRRTVIARRRPGKRGTEQIIAANVDRLVPVFAAAEPAPHWRMLDRYLVIAEDAGVDPLICITKADLVDRDDLEEDLGVYRRVGYDVVVTSSSRGEGIEDVRAGLDGSFSVLVGPSGVGKSTLLNSIEPGLGRRTSGIGSANSKGRHTTTASELCRIGEATYIADTPGVRELGLWDVACVDHCFPEMVPLLDGCRFGADCSHSHEIGCAVKEAVESGVIDGRRYDSYLRLIGTD